ncbi:MAG: hypothetical protein COB62_00280 [Piscirickettsiaceae bacterium]|nr:MAG: hypothetical protein COB62_00280 [Piscirickettsiaceae bacterium]
MSIKKVCLLLVFLVPVNSVAENAYDFGDYVVYYNAFTADTLPPQMATAYGILRSKYKGVLNLSIQKKQNPGKLPQPVSADVKVMATNLVGQLKNLDLRKVTEGKAIYYISEFRISHKERVTFNVTLMPQGETKALELKFTRQFYID